MLTNAIMKLHVQHALYIMEIVSSVCRSTGLTRKLFKSIQKNCRIFKNRKVTEKTLNQKTVALAEFFICLDLIDVCVPLCTYLTTVDLSFAQREMQ